MNRGDKLAGACQQAPLPCMAMWMVGKAIVIVMDPCRSGPLGVVPSYAEEVDPETILNNPDDVVREICMRALGAWMVANG